MFNHILLPASIAGICAALVLSLAQAFWVTPLILQAEELEHSVQSGVHRGHEHVAGSHHHDENAWQPENGWQRTLWTAASNSVMGIGFALILCGLYLLRHPASWAHGLLWGLAGYLTFFAAPSIGLPPELPGTESAELFARQSWWLFTAAATACGLGMMLLQSRLGFRVVGMVLLLVPHAIGAPHPDVTSSLAPEEMQLHFRIAASCISALFWMVLGVLSATTFRYFSRQKESGHG